MRGWLMLSTSVAEYFPIPDNIFVYSRDRSTNPPVLEAWDLVSQGWNLEQETRNLVVTSGKILVARLAADELNFDTGITFCEVGTDTATPTLADTNITVATARGAITRVIRSGARVQFRTFYAAQDVTANLRKTGLYGSSDASATTGSGDLFNNALISLDNSAGSKDLTIVHEVTFG